MGKLKKDYEFLNYLQNPLTRDTIKAIYDNNDVVYERSELYSDFIQTLLDKIFTTYLGDEITDNKDQVLHFNWCWNKTVESFKKEDVIFEDNVLGKNYFQNFMLDEFYHIEDKNEIIINKIKKVWVYIFDYTIIKVRLDVDTFVTLYKMFDKSLKNQ